MCVSLCNFSLFFGRYALLTLSAGGATGLDLPDVVFSYPVEIEGLGYVVGSHGWRKIEVSTCMLSYVKNELKLTTVNILLVGEDEEDNIAHFAILDDAAKFGFGFFHASSIARVNYEDESVSACWLVLLACCSESLTSAGFQSSAGI